jgi:HEAT repeat protein
MRRFAFVLCLAATTFADDAAVPETSKVDGRTAVEWAAELSSQDVTARRKAVYALWNLGAAATPAAPSLAKALGDDDDYVRTTAGKTIEKLDPAAVKPTMAEIAASLSDERESARRGVASLVWRLGPLAAEIVPQLTAALDSEDPVVRANAAASLGNAGAAARSALDALQKLFADDEEPRKWAVTAVARIDPLVAFASDRAEVRLVALQSVGGLSARSSPEPKIVAGVIRLIDDPDESVREWATHALDTFANNTGGTRLEWIPIFRRVLETDRAPSVRGPAACGLGRYAGHGPAVVPPLRAAARSREAVVRYHALLALGWLNVEARSAVPEVTAALRSSDPDSRAAAAIALGRIGDPSDDVLVELISVMRDPDRSAARCAVDALGALGKRSPRLGIELTSYLADPKADPFVCGHVVHAIAATGAARVAVPALTTVLEDFPNTPPSVAYALCALDAPVAPRALERLMAVAGEDVPGQDLLVLLRLLGPKAAAAAPLVVRALQSEDEAVRTSAAVALGAFGPDAKDALPALEAVAEDEAPMVALAARRAIEAIRLPPAK